MLGYAKLKCNTIDPFEDKWQALKPIVWKILNQKDISDSDWQESISTVIHICDSDIFENGADKLRNQLEKEISSFLTNKIRSKIVDKFTLGDFIKSYVEEWEKYFATFDSMSKLFLHIEEFTMLNESMRLAWKGTIFCERVSNSLMYSALTLISKERNGKTFDSLLVFKLKESWENLFTSSHLLISLHDKFQKSYIKDIRLFYTDYAPNYLQFNAVHNYLRFKNVDQFLQFYDINNYLQLNGEDIYDMYTCYTCMQYVTSKFEEEEARGKKYFETHSNYWTASENNQLLVETYDKILFPLFKENIIAGYLRMIKCNEKLRLMFGQLGQFDRITDGIKHISKIFEKFIVDVGLADMKSAASTITQDPESYVEQLVKFYNDFNQLVKRVFNADHNFVTSLDNAFKVVMNDTTVFMQFPTQEPPESRCSQLLALYCNSFLKKSSSKNKLLTDKISKKLKTAISLLNYIKNKDVFMKFYKSHLSRRLILETSADSEMEGNMVNWLRNVGMPFRHVNDLAKMLQDIKISTDFNNEFKGTQNAEGKLMAGTISVKILNDSAWALRNDNASVSLPIELENYILQVEEFYKSKHNGRKLQFHHHMSKGIITFVNEAGKFELTVTTFQMAVLFAWNDRPKHRISFENLKLDTKLSDTNLRKTLWSFIAFPKIKQQLLLCDSDVKSSDDFDDSTELWINQEFRVMRKTYYNERIIQLINKKSE